MSNIAGFIFDLDGVLVDTAEYHFRAWKRLADEEGLPFDRKVNEALRGIPRHESLRIILKGRRLPEEKFQALLERKNRYYLEQVSQITPEDMLPGTCSLLEEICTSGLKSAIGSSSKNTYEVMDHLGIKPFFDVVADGNSIVNPKPAPDLFLYAAAKLALSPESCVVVEDAAAGIQAAQVGGFHSIGLGPKERVGEAELVLPSLEGVHLQQLLAMF